MENSTAAELNKIKDSSTAEAQSSTLLATSNKANPTSLPPVASLSSTTNSTETKSGRLPSSIHQSNMGLAGSSNATPIPTPLNNTGIETTRWVDEAGDVMSAGGDSGLATQLDSMGLGESTMNAESVLEVKSVAGLIESSQHVEIKLAEQQSDTQSPLYSAKTFEELGLPENILKGVYAMKFNKPSKVQEKALPLLLSNPPQNMIAQSQSGTGKTAAFALTMLCRTNPELQAPQALCLSPSRELARQTLAVLRQMGQFTPFTFAALLKESNEDDPEPTGSSITEQSVKNQILVGTPGTVLELKKRGLLDLKHLKILVFDEADQMLDKQSMGVQSVRLKQVCPAGIQTLLFSATFKTEVMAFAHRLVPNPNTLTLKREELSIDAIRQFYMRVRDIPSKFKLLSDIYGLLSMGQSIIFVHTRDTAEKVQAHMTLEGHPTSLLIGSLSPTDRDKVIDDFRHGKTRVLIATNVIARGIDILQVSLVINFDIPLDVEGKPDPETYLHRIGRTGRFGRSGVAINFIHDTRSWNNLQAIQKFFGKPILEIATHNLESLDAQLNQV